ncbi:MAG: TIGR01777 family oxidoreductase [Bacteroidota bacterium]
MQHQPKHILLTGGSGLLGTELTKLLLDKGYIVSHLSRKAGNNPNVKTFIWDVEKGVIDEDCIDGADTIIHLAGAGIADSRWTDARKKIIVESRTKSIALVYDLLKRKPHQVKKVISASGIGYYSDRDGDLMHEDSKPAHDFMGECCIAWEQAVNAGADLGLDILIFRTGVAFTKDGGALIKMGTPVKLGIGSPLGSGKQWLSWIHHRDVSAMYLYGIEQAKLTGIYNMVAPTPVTNKLLTKAIANQFKRPLWLPNVPAFVLKLLLGEMATIVLGSTKVSATKIEEAGFQFKYPGVEDALKEIYG